MPHPTHRLKAYTGDVRKPLVFCGLCGIEENEPEISDPCTEKFCVVTIDTPKNEFYSGLPFDG